MQEVAMLEAARSALEQDPRRSLGLMRVFERRFPSPELAREREFITLRALVALGRLAEARDLAERMLRAQPSGVYAERIRRLLQRAQPGSPPGVGLSGR